MEKKFEKSVKLNIKKIFFIYFVFFLLFLFALYKFFSITTNYDFNAKNIHMIENTKHYPDLWTSDGKLLATNIKVYDFFIDMRHINQNYLKLYLNNITNIIKVNISYKKIEKGIHKRNRVLILSDLTYSDVAKIKSLNKIYIKMGFFKKITKLKKYYIYGPEFVKKNKKTRRYRDNILAYQPMLGKYTSSDIGVNGIEKYYYDKYYNKEIKFYKSDKFGTKLYKKINKVQDNSITLSIHSGLQEDINKKLEKQVKAYDADNVVVAVVKTETGEILAMAQSKKYIDGKTYDKNDFTQYYYEAGSVFKPITLTIALENKYVTDMQEEIDVNYGKLRIGRKTITDDEKDDKYLTVENIIVHSSNVGITKIALRMINNEFFNGITKMKFFSQDSLEMSNVKRYLFPTSLKKKLIQNKLIQRATTSFGYGFSVTPYNILRMYNIIANNGVYVPLTLKKLTVDEIKNLKKEKIISSKTTKLIQQTLQKVVQRGTAVGTNINSLNIYGKTGTAHRNEKGKYINSYNSTFVGFVSDKHNNRYTIIVLVQKPDWLHHFASLSAVPTFKSVIKTLIKNNLLIPNIN
jgi:cell division protein FtsI (penicillin-binding protein 3)